MSTTFWKQQSLAECLSSSKRRRKRAGSPEHDEGQDTDSDVAAIHFEPKVDDASDQDLSPRRPKRRKSHAVGTGSEEDTVASAPRHPKGKNNRTVLDSEDDVQPRKRKLTKGARPPTPEQDDDDDDDDDDILDGENQVLDSRLRSRGKTTAFQRNLEKLKSRKRGEIVLESTSSEADQSESSADVPFKGAKPHHSGESDDADSSEDEDDFIVDDDAVGAPTPQLPLAFSMSTHQDLTHHFKIICQLFVHMAVRPLADRRPFLERTLKEEEYLSVPLQVTRRKLSGIRDSLVTSSVWRADFKKLLEKYPEFNLFRLKTAIRECDACRLGSRLSTLLGRLSGKPYDHYDFENVSVDESDDKSSGEDDEDEDSDEDEDEDEDSDSGAVEKRDPKKEFHLGRFCAARTRAYHQFCHWEYSLYKALQLEIMEAQDERRQFVKVAYAGGVKPPEDLHDADKVMEWLDERGIIDKEWQKVREMMDKARRLERGETEDM